MSLINGEDYKKRIEALTSTVWYDGEKITGNIGEHPAFRGAVQSQAALYDLQTDPALKDTMTTIENGELFGTSYLIPKTKADLTKRREMVQKWACHTGGLMGRSPDYMNTVLASFVASQSVFQNEENCFPDTLERFYMKAREKDLSFTHTFINPQNNRSKLAFLEKDHQNARIIKKTDDGIIIRGAKLLATQGGITDELLVYSAPGAQEKEQAYAFSVPTDTRGLTFVCRSSLTNDNSRFNSPLSSRFEEMDAIVLFDNVCVPWDRVFFYENIRAANNLYVKGMFVPFTLHQIVSRQVIKAELILGIALKIVDEINIGEYQHVQSKIAEMVKGTEMLKALLHHSEQTASKNEDGVMVPARLPLYTAINQFQDLYPRFTEIIQLLGASGLITLPTERDFHSEIGTDLSGYLKTCESSGEEKVALFRLAWDLTMSGFGTRQTLYERFFFGDPIRLQQTIYHTFDNEGPITLADQFLQRKS
ncbi:4-hydroxyphenylacetate 3-monooxygenase, oxygenase component [Halobacillus locisalis]|uniref:4-hydroxyphenylacetate 3-monooxygenase, oxygenase component n=1 Tax=Halobacillus locisalis TaxID=220753 RepID=A0A838CUV9_9BACI|nr:4-hydroxyphenylacetate 3-monooxygenase, oxygenase component [Halobacillus locisalis]MBA2175698.1 4-hydroxyphenylacetate 3-monooxygenase, oxygenase component [Halobacillus locisalis]